MRVIAKTILRRQTR